MNADAPQFSSHLASDVFALLAETNRAWAAEAAAEVTRREREAAIAAEFKKAKTTQANDVRPICPKCGASCDWIYYLAFCEGCDFVGIAGSSSAGTAPQP